MCSPVNHNLITKPPFRRLDCEALSNIRLYLIVIPATEIPPKQAPGLWVLPFKLGGGDLLPSTQAVRYMHIDCIF